MIRTLFAAALLMLAACSPPSATTTSSGKPGDVAQAQPAAPPIAPQSPPASGKPASGGVTSANLITPQFLYGRWGDNGDCTKDIVFNPDGTFTVFTGGSGQWRIVGDTVSMTGPAGTFSLQMRFIDQDHLMLRNPDGSVGTSQRC